MLGSTLLLTLATLAGLLAGFAREWLLVAAWGAGSRSDAFLVAVFIPEALRMTLAAGILAAAALPLYQERDAQRQHAWLAGLSPRLLGLGLGLYALLALSAPLWIRLIGPGLDSAAQAEAAANLRSLAACIPGLLLHALFSIPLHARQRFVLPGLGSLLFNLPPVLYLFFYGQASLGSGLSLAFFLGSLLMCLSLVPAIWQTGWRPWQVRGDAGASRELLVRLGPLLTSNLASQGLALVERVVASYLGEGAVTWVNLARKLINLPLIALMSLNQVLLGLMSGKSGDQRLGLLHRGLNAATLLSLPAALGLVGASPALIHWLLPAQSADGPLPALLGWFAVSLVFGAWNAMLARYAYAAGDTRTPLYCELLGSLLNALLLAGLPLIAGLNAIPLAALGGVILTNLLLMQRQQLLSLISWPVRWAVSAVLLGAAALLLHPLPNVWLQLGLSTVAGLLLLIALGLWLKPWRA
ncbi:Pellicle/biofilm biosynthesis inner membrane protein PslK, MATE transporter family [Pseudomonas chlororaphis subsp. aureofaciens]|uniref:Pellicle/biofilm biosynthesis inner membrane protein PslK, MATE transporter family n=1 Tax=Pseudomonas chlororaphis subsp. aureofaciens TaxID=587851 RepID=A0AAD1E8F9_9PSED|nr:lipid II flippase MurJ [Pseudomonas chlororaphis]AZE25908.1 Pellicle/biofilm biosynthesis inner membrane protein PslK, MATE transporter family [Pseudomonas chlororaphis subsp. aureofaciens]AZE32178.1 Pellicle/biofilm biosynthesis inner membrane protein PslK, MATE transporter family [Pseudomonas chlororaphis subsp. aureofaciens]AZE38458.1 Pellicle/biofilm biosynthesis inner membrane protein PslK, MATE transporter family [Pseudomonas chlororaphis subsp. aureofaciens]AZE44815.1 Pellicle/biofilm